MKLLKRRSNNRGRQTPFPAVARIHQMVDSGAKVCSTLSGLTPNCVYFAVPRHRPDQGVRRVLWNLWGVAEVYAPKAFQLVQRAMGRIRYPKSIATRINELTSQPLNGNCYATPALAQGAGVAVVDTYRLRGKQFIFVPNTEQALLDVAAYHRRQFVLPCIGITGSCGKTTTKELVKAVMSSQFKTVATDENFNTLRGVAHTVLEIDATSEVAVVEVSSTGADSIERKCQIVQPTLGVITAIGKAHLEGYGTIDNVAKMKQQLLDATDANGGVVFINLDDPRIAPLAKQYRQVRTFGASELAMTRGRVLEADEFLVVEIDAEDHAKAEPLVIHTRLFGRYNLTNILAAVAFGRHLGIPDSQIGHAIANYEPRNHRSQLIRRGSTTFIADAYNANPTSVIAALDSFREFRARRKIVILGDMAELGPYATSEHKAVLDHLEKLAFDEVVVVGTEFAKVSHPQIDLRFTDYRQLMAWLPEQRLDDCAVFIKGSLSMNLQLVIERV